MRKLILVESFSVRIPSVVSVLISAKITKHVLTLIVVLSCFGRVWLFSKMAYTSLKAKLQPESIYVCIVLCTVT